MPKRSKPILFSAVHTSELKFYTKEYLTHPRKEGKLKTTILNTVRVKIRDRDFSNNTAPDMDENSGGTTGLAKNCKERRICIALSTPASYQKNLGLLVKNFETNP